MSIHLSLDHQGNLIHGSIYNEVILASHRFKYSLTPLFKNHASGFSGFLLLVWFLDKRTESVSNKCGFRLALLWIVAYRLQTPILCTAMLAYCDRLSTGSIGLHIFQQNFCRRSVSKEYLVKQRFSTESIGKSSNSFDFSTNILFISQRRKLIIL